MEGPHREEGLLAVCGGPRPEARPPLQVRVERSRGETLRTEVQPGPVWMGGQRVPSRHWFLRALPGLERVAPVRSRGSPGRPSPQAGELSRLPVTWRTWLRKCCAVNQLTGESRFH